MTYGEETWTINAKLNSKLQSTETDFLRRSTRCSKLDKIRNATIRQKMNFNETIMQFVGNKQLQWFGHAKRMAEDRLPVRSLEWVPNGGKRRGRPKKTWIEGILKVMIR